MAEHEDHVEVHVDDDVRSISSVRSTSSQRSSASVRAMDRRAHLAALQEQSKFAEDEAKLLAAQRETELKLKQLDIAKQMAIARAELAVYEDEEVTFPKLRQQVVSSPNHVVLQSVSGHFAEEPAHVSMQSTHHSDESTSQVPVYVEPQPYQCQQLPTTRGMMAAMGEYFNYFRLPKLELSAFGGDPLEFQQWRMSFQKIVEEVTPDPSHRLQYLQQFTSGDASMLVSGFMLDQVNGYENAMKELTKEFGDPYVLARAYIAKIDGWPQIKASDTIGLRSFVTLLKKCRGSIDTLRHLRQLNTDLYLQKVIVKFPMHIQASWRKTVTSLEDRNVDVTFPELVDFLDKQSKIVRHPVFSAEALLEAEGKAKVAVSNKTVPSFPKRKAVYVTATESAVNASTCPQCSESHDLDDCQQYLRKSLDDRHRFLVNKKLCFSCYGQTSRGHTARSCRSRRTCGTCGRRHPTGLHGYRPAQQQLSVVNSTEASSSVNTSCATHIQSSSVAMSIVMVRVFHGQNEVIVYAALDSMSSACFVTSDVCRQLGVDGEPTEITIKTMSDECRQETAVVQGLHIQSVLGGESVPLPKAYVQHSIPVDADEIPSHDMLMKWAHLKNLVSKMPERDANIPVGLLIGANCPKALQPQQIVSAEGTVPFAVKTVLGWCVSGPMFPTESHSYGVLCHRILARECQSKVVDTGLKDMMISMYEHDFNEVKSESSCMSQEDIRFMSLLQTEARLVSGHYELPLPFRRDDVAMPNNRSQAVQRMGAIKKRFEVNEKFKSDYTKFMNDIIDKGYARGICSEQNSAESDSKQWYLPHHGVYHPQKPNKIRVVFDCSSQYAGKSLNQQLLSGPNQTNSLLGILIRFRQERVAFLADIEAMFYQVRIAEKHTNFTRFVWWPNGDMKSELADYTMTVHLFGATSSPGCAQFALKKTADDNEAAYGAEVADTLRRNFYVDDLLKSVDSVSQARSLALAVKDMCAEGGFRLTKFVSNDPRALEAIPEADRARVGGQVDLSQPTSIERALGIHWCVENDSLEFRITMKDRPLTRRGMLSTVSSIYDPLGLAAPFLLKGKKLLQELCSLKAEWDEEIGDDTRASWEQWRAGLPALEYIKIPRCLKSIAIGEVSDVSLHHFSDASTVGYGACSYVRFVGVGGSIHCSLLVGKSRVSPLKPVTIPRLELTAATVAVKVGRMLESELDYGNLRSFYWTDSNAVLGFINNEARRFHIFVANRAHFIRTNSEISAWRHVNTEDNPADDASRGLNCLSVNSSHRWFNGPAFLWTAEDCWPKSTESNFQLENCGEMKKSVYAVNAVETLNFLDLLEKRVSNWYTLKKFVVIWLRFVEYIVTKSVSERGAPKVAELDKAEQIILRSVQRRHFQQEVLSLSSCSEGQKSRPVRKSSSIFRLNPMLDAEGLLRVGGRLRRSFLDDGLKHPVILPKNSHVAYMIVLWCHVSVKHGGRSLTLNEVRSNGFWIIAGNSVVRSIIHKCVTCRGLRGSTANQKMSDLPVDRVSPAPPFTYCAVDLFGPFVIKEGRRELKRYGCLFTCLACRAIHIETTNSLDTASFINALRRFIARRGNIRILRSDNGTNFVGAERELNEACKTIDAEKVSRFLSKQGADFIKWKRNPPLASHMGGVWERQIRSVRAILSALLKQHGHLLDDELFRTLLIEVEAVVNGRPLTVESLSDPNGPCPLSPSQLLTMKSSAVVPPLGVFEKPYLFCRRRWRRVQHIANEFWSRWSKEYLTSLQPRSKNITVFRNFQVGDIVLVKDDSLMRNEWPLAKVVSVHMDDKQECVRSVSLRMATHDLTAKRVIKERPVNKLVLLLESEQWTSTLSRVCSDTCVMYLTAILIAVLCLT